MNSSAIRTHSSAPHGQHYLSLAINDIEQIWNCTWIWYRHWKSLIALECDIWHCQMFELRLNLALTETTFKSTWAWQWHWKIFNCTWIWHWQIEDQDKLPFMSFSVLLWCIHLYFLHQNCCISRNCKAEEDDCPARHLQSLVAFFLSPLDNQFKLININIFIGKWPVTKKRGQDNHQQHYYK